MGAVLLAATSPNAIDTIPSENINPNQPQLRILQTSTHTLQSNPIYSSSPFPFHSNSSFISCQFLIYGPGGTGKTFVMKVVQGFLERWNKNVTSVARSALAAHHPCCWQTDSISQAKVIWQLTWKMLTSPFRMKLWCVDHTALTLSNILCKTACKVKGPLEVKSYCYLDNFQKILSVIDGRARALMIHVRFKTSSLYRQFCTSRYFENLPLKVLINAWTTKPGTLSFPISFQLLVKDAIQKTNWTVLHYFLQWNLNSMTVDSVKPLLQHGDQLYSRWLVYKARHYYNFACSARRNYQDCWSIYAARSDKVHERRHRREGKPECA